LNPQTRYAKSGRVSIAYQVVGDGPIDLVFIPGYVSNVEQYWEMPAAARAFRRFASFARLIPWDKRGTGLSDPVARVPTLDERVEDLRAVMDAAGSERAALMGISEGGPVALLFAATHPERVSALVLYGTTPKFRASPDWEWGWSSQQFSDILEDVDQKWGQGALLGMFAPSLANEPAAVEAYGRLQRTGASPAMGRAVFEAVDQVDCRDILPAISVPTLILHRTDECAVRVEAARYMAQHIRGAKLVEYPGIDHSFLLGDTDRVLDDIEEFLTGVRPGRVVDRVLATVLFTDIVASTERAVQMGDRRWRDLLAAHDAAVRRELVAFGGKEINWTGDGFVATFAGPSRALECACSVRDAVRRLGIDIRAGLHTGECELLAGDQLGGLAVHIGARVAALAGAGEVLLSSMVKDLVAGSGIEFVERGRHTLKGVPGEWNLFAVKV